MNSKTIKWLILAVVVVVVLTFGIKDESVDNLLEEYPTITKQQAEGIVEQCPSKFLPKMDEIKQTRFCREKLIGGIKNG